MAFFQIVFDSVYKCLCSLGDHSDVVSGSYASKPKGASYSEFSPPKLRVTDLSTNLSSNIEDDHIFASRTTSRYSTPLPSIRHAAENSSPVTLEATAEHISITSKNEVVQHDKSSRDVDSAVDRKTAEVLAKARIEAMKGTAIRNRRSIGADVTHNTVPSPSRYLGCPLNERSHKRRMEIFRPRLSPNEEIVDPKRAYNCGASADDAFHLAASIFRAQDDQALEGSPLPMLCFAKPIREVSERAKNLNQGHSFNTTDSNEDSSTASSCIYQVTHNHLSASPLRPLPLYDHYLVMVTEDHTDEIARIMKSGTHKSFEWMHFDDSSEYMNTGSEDKQDPTLAVSASTKRLSHDDVHIFEGHTTFLAPVSEENEAVSSIVQKSSIETI